MSEPTTFCAMCGDRIEWLEPPNAGGWWAHEHHPADEHDARPDESSLRERVIDAIHDAQGCDCGNGIYGRAGRQFVHGPTADAALAVVREALPDQFHESEAVWQAGWNTCLREIERRLS